MYDSPEDCQEIMSARVARPPTGCILALGEETKGEDTLDASKGESSTSVSKGDASKGAETRRGILDASMHDNWKRMDLFPSRDMKRSLEDIY